MLAIRGERLQMEAAALSGLTQSKISRVEQGRTVLTPDEADSYARALGASDERRRQLVRLAQVTEAGAITTRATLLRKAHLIQRRIRELEASTNTVRSWLPDVVPGVLQTWEYTLAVNAPIEPDAAWTRERRARVAQLDDTSRSWHQLLSEAALRWVLRSAEVMDGQVAHLIEVSRRPNVRFGLLPLGRALPFPAPRGFHLYGDRAAEVATDVGTHFLTESRDLAHFAQAFAELDGYALYGDELRERLAEIRASY
jgi:transcriptional regulator with XRE-family HTH domain